MAPQPQRRSRKHPFIIIIGIIVAVLAAVGLYAAFGNRESLHETNMSVVDAVSTTPTGADVVDLDKTEAFWAYFKNATEQQKLVITKVEAAVQNPGDQLVSARQTYTKAGLDYATKKDTHYSGFRIEYGMTMYRMAGLGISAR